MATAKKYSYKDWWEGKICLIYAIIVYHENQIKGAPRSCTWEHFKQADIQKIKRKQKEIFNKEVNKVTKIWKADFTKRYKKSKIQSFLLNGELSKFHNILFGSIPAITYSDIPVYNILFKSGDISTIKNYIINTKVNGGTAEFDFVHSPNYKFQDKNKIPNEIYAECCWQYFNWLESNLEKREQDQQTSKSKSPEIIRNPHPEIFKNAQAYKMFLELKEKTVTPRTRVADYGFIFHKMRNKNLYCINPGIHRKDFIEFLNRKCGAKIKGTILPFKNPARKKPFWDALEKEYKAEIPQHPFQ